MPTSPPQNLARHRALFVLLLVAIAGALAYMFLPSGPWIVPEEAKQRTNPLPASGAAAALREIRPIYLDKCGSCHGDGGKGDGHDASRYDPRPTDFSDAQKMDAVSDGELFYKLSEGHRPMPAFKRRLSEQQRWQMVLMMRSFAHAPATGTPPANDAAPVSKP